MTFKLEPEVCRQTRCTKSYMPHRGGKRRASQEGWYLSRVSGNSYCPAHIPDWVIEWRARKAEGKS